MKEKQEKKIVGISRLPQYLTGLARTEGTTKQIHIKIRAFKLKTAMISKE